MYTALIVDDEPHVCQLILHLVDWRSLNIQVVGVAHSGKEAYALIEEQQPDIVITDIRMPGIDGLELVRLVAEKKIPTHFIIISGYRYFEYAHSALRYNVHDYLLKPINKNELEDCLRKICSRLLESAQREKATHFLEEQLHISREMLHQHFLQSIYRNPKAFCGHETAQLFMQYQLPFEPGQYQIAIFRLDDNNKAADISQRNTLLSVALNSVSSNFEGIQIVRCIDRSCLILFLNYPCQYSNSVCQSMSDFFRSLTAYVERFDGMVLTGAVGKDSSEFEDLPQLMESAIYALRRRIVLGVGSLYYYELNTLKTLPFSSLLSVKQEQQLTSIIASLNSEAFNRWFFQGVENFLKKPHTDPNVFWEFFDYILQNIFNVLATSNEDKQELLNGRNMLDDACNLTELCRMFSNLVYTYLRRQKQQLYQHEHLAIQRIKEYIASNYMRRIKLDDIANYVHLNPSYVSTLFKKETNSNITDYLTLHRLEVAKKLLKSTTQTIAEISYAVGYNDTKYFTKLFSKEIGISPTQYRRLYQ